MNLSRGWLLRSKPRCLSPASVVICLSLLAFAPLSHAAWQGPTLHSPQAAEADVLPGAAQPAVPDLLLDPDNTAKAEALAAFSKAIIAEDNADSDQALNNYQKALALDPGYTELAVKVAFDLARRGDPSSGIQVLKDSIKANPKAPLAYLYLSQLYANNLSKPQLGLKYAQQALDLDPANFASYLAVYEICITSKQRDKALAVLDRAAGVQGASAQFSLQLGETYLKYYGDDPIPADQVEKIGAVYRRALDLNGNDPMTLAQVASFYARVRKEKTAIPLYLKAIRLSPANPPDGDQTLALIRDSLARCFDATGNTPEAIATVKDLIKANPLRYESYDLLCSLYEKSDNTDAALAVCQQMMLLNPGDSRNYIREAALLMKQKKYDDAIQMLADARSKFPTEAQVTYSLGLALSEAKRFREALGIFDQANEEASQGQTEMLDAQFYFAYGAAAEQSGEIEKAASLLKKSIDLDPHSAAEAYNYLGYMWVDRGMKLDEGGELIKKALQLDPDNPAFEDNLGWYYFKKGDLKRAIAILKKASSQIQPEDATVDEHLGDAYDAANDTTRALDYWQRAAGIDKDNKEITVKIANARQKLARQGAPVNTSNP